MTISNRSITRLAVLAGCLLLLGGSLMRSEPPMAPQDDATGAKTKVEPQEPQAPVLDEFQRSGQVLYLQRFGKQGADRGKEIYFMKCWICHNEFAVESDPTGAPTLKGLFERPKLRNGQAVNDETVRNQIKNGSARMPAYKWGLSDKDLGDLMVYLKTQCCWDPDHPPANPLYRYH